MTAFKTTARRIGWILVIFLGLLVMALGWLTATHAGLKFAINQAESLSGHALHIQHAKGRLIGPLTLEKLTYTDASQGIQVKLDQLKADWDIGALWQGALTVTHFNAKHLDIHLSSRKEKAKSKIQVSEGHLSLAPPLAIIINNLHIQDLTITQDKAPFFKADKIDLAARWDQQGIRVQQFVVDAPDGHIELVGHNTLGASYAGQAKLAFHWQQAGYLWQGQLSANSHAGNINLHAALAQPVASQLDLTASIDSDLPWQLHLLVPATSPKSILGDTALKKAGIDLHAHGNDKKAILDGEIQLNQTHIHLDPASIDIPYGDEQVFKAQFTATSPDIEGRIHASASTNLNQSPQQWNATLHWQDLLLPESLVGQALASTGKLHFTGNADHFTATSTLDAGPPGQLAHLKLALEGNPQQLLVKTLRIQQPKGFLAIQGNVHLAPQIQWDLSIQSKHFNPGAWLVNWPGSINSRLTTRGHWNHSNPQISLAIDQLNGQLRQRPVKAKGTLTIPATGIVNGNLSLKSGKSTVKVNAQGEQTNHVAVQLRIASLSDWLPDAGGALHGTLKSEGLWPHLSLSGQIKGKNLHLKANRVGALDLDMTIDDIQNPAGQLKLRGKQLRAGPLHFRTLSLSGNGNASDQKVSLKAKGSPLSLRLKGKGHTGSSAWQVILSTLAIHWQGLPTWALKKNSTLTWKQGNGSVSNLCLQAKQAVFCLDGNMTPAGETTLAWHLQHLPLKFLLKAQQNPLPIKTDGELSSRGKLTRTTKGQWVGHARIGSSQGKFYYSDNPREPLLFYRDLQTVAHLSPDKQQLTTTAQLNQHGVLNSKVTLKGAEQKLKGHVDVTLNNLGAIEIFTTALANSEGHLNGHIKLGGTLASPQLNGGVHLTRFKTEIPTLGLQLNHTSLAATMAPHGDVIHIQGTAHSGKGKLDISGALGLDTHTASSVTLSGTQFQVADIPGAQIAVTPDIKAQRSKDGIKVDGSVSLDKAHLILDKLPGMDSDGGIQTSPDVVVVDDNTPHAHKNPLPLHAHITVNLGDDTTLTGYGVDGKLQGMLSIEQSPGSQATGRGQIDIAGTYKAYGVNLDIQKGQLLYASTPIDNPGLNIRAIRRLHPNATINDNEVVGLAITGTARRPVMTIFSNPAMPQSDALAYLITGKPLRAATEDDSNSLTMAAQALGSATGNLLAKGLGDKLGLETSVSSNDALGTTAFTVGKYLSPRLYMSYGIGLFESGQVLTLRYLLSKRWNFEAEQSTRYSRSSFNYRLEK